MKAYLGLQVVLDKGNIWKQLCIFSALNLHQVPSGTSEMHLKFSYFVFKRVLVALYQILMPSSHVTSGND